MARRARLIPITVMALLLAACGATADAGDDGTPASELDGDWTLTSGTGPGGEVPLGDGVEVTLTVDGSAWSGQVCNHYSGEVEVTGATITIGPMIRTEMACADPRLMEAEATYHAALETVTTVDVTGDELTLSGDGAELIYDRVAPIPDADLVGTTWILESLLTGSGPDGTASSAQGDAQLALDPDGTFTYGTGCNRGGGTYTSDGETVRFAPEESTSADCGEIGFSAMQDDHVRGVLDGEVTATVEGDRLTLTGDDLGLVYRATRDDGLVLSTLDRSLHDTRLGDSDAP